MPPSPVVVEVPAIVAPRPSASFASADSEPKLMPAMVIGILSSIGFLAKRVPIIDIGAAFLAIALERIARDRGAEEQQVVEMRQLALGAGATDIINAGGRSTADLRESVIVEAWPICGAWCAECRGPCGFDSIGVGIVDVEIVELAGRAIAPEPPRIGLDLAPARAAAPACEMLVASFPSRCSRRRGCRPCRHIESRLIDRIAERFAGIAAARRDCRPAP